MHTVPEQPYPSCDGVERRVDKKMPIVVFERARYSVPYELMGKTVFVRHNRVTDKVVINYRDSEGMIRQVASHDKAGAGDTILAPEHFPPGQPSGPLTRSPKATSPVEARFLDIGPGAVAFVRAGADNGVSKLGQRLAKIVQIVPLYGTDRVDRALGMCASTARFTIEDVISIMERAKPADSFTVGDEDSLAQGTGGWAQMKGTMAC